MSTPSEEIDLRAGEYVLGTLDAEERRRMQAEIARDPALAEAVAAWERRLAPLAMAVPPVPPPPELWTRIEAAISAPPENTVVRLWRSPGFWRATAVSALALAASLAVVLVRGPPRASHYATALVTTQGPAPAWLAETRPDGSIVMTALGRIQRPAGKDLELWALPDAATRPIPLGILPVSGSRTVAAKDLPAARDHLKLLVSVEPPGGSPTGAPTGPVIYGGELVATD